MSDEIIIRDQTVTCANGEGSTLTAPLAHWLRTLKQQCINGLTAEPFADRVKWHITCGQLDVVILELEPALRLLQWIAPDSPAPYGPTATSKPRRLATPFVILKVPFRRKRVVPRVELFYRNEPLQSASGPGGELRWPNLLNVSPNAHGCTAWFCSQFLDSEATERGITAGLNAVCHHLWGGHFNLSSEAHESQSAFSKTRDEGVDPRVIDVDRWEEESIRDPRFVLDVPWPSTGLTVHKLIVAELAAHGIAPWPASAAALGNCVFRARRPTGEITDED